MSEPSTRVVKLAGISILVVLLTGTALAVGTVGYRRYTQRQADERALVIRANENALQELSCIGSYSDAEQKLIDDTHGDSERTRMVLVRIHTNRITYWNGERLRLQSVIREFKSKILATKNEGEWTPNTDRLAREVVDKIVEKDALITTNIDNYTQALDKLNAWVAYRDVSEIPKVQPQPENNLRRM